MSRFKIAVLFFLLFLSYKAYAETLNNIEVVGNKRISKETIMVLADLSLNQTIDNDILNYSLKKLYSSNFFSDIDINFQNGKLKISLVERPIIDELLINGIKKKSFLDFIQSKIQLKNRMSFSEDILNNDINIIKEILKNSGYYFATIESSMKEDDNLNSVKIFVDIDLGKKAKIKDIVFLGDKKIKDKKLLEIISSEKNKFWKFISNKVYLNQNQIELDKRLLANFYKNQGYYNVEILDTFVELENEESFNLIYNIDAGDLFYFGNFSLSLPEDYNVEDFKNIEKIFLELKNKKYSLNNINKIINEIDTVAASRLYDFISADVNEKIIANNKLDFSFTVTDSEKFYVERINILGNYNTIEEVIRNRLIVDEGDPFNNLLFNKSINQIKSLDIFKNVTSEIIDNPDSNLKTVNISVEEKPTGEISLGAGYGTSGGVVGGSITEKNFLGKGITLNSDLEMSTQGIKGRITYAQPNFNYTENTLFTSVKATTTDNLSDYGYKMNEIGFSLGTKYEQYENLFFSPELDFSLESLKTNSSASSALKKQEGNYEDFYFNYGLDYDLRNSSFDTSSGYRSTFNQQLPLISNNYELINSFIFTKYQPLNKDEDMVGKASLYLKNVSSINGKNSRISKRAFIPYNRLRGFEKGKVGPVDNSDYIGGNNIVALNFSTNLPAILPSFENLDFTYFVDIANVWGVDYDSSIDSSNFFRSSTGIGLDFLTPIGPLSFSLTHPITKKTTDKTETFRFHLGTTF